MKVKPLFFKQWDNIWFDCLKIEEVTNMPLWAHSLNYVLQRKEISKIIIGVASIDQFSDLLGAIKMDYVMPEIVKTIDENLLNPTRWIT